MVAALMASAIGGCPEGQAEALRLRLPQLLWKVTNRFRPKLSLGFFPYSETEAVVGLGLRVLRLGVFLPRKM